MNHLSRRLAAVFLAAALGFGAVAIAGAAESPPRFNTGLGFEFISRTISWDKGAQTDRLRSLLVTVREDIALSPGLSLGLSAGLSLANPSGLVFRELPISLDYEAGSMPALAAGASLRGRLASLGDFEIDGEARVVSSLGFAKKSPLEGFAVEGSSTAKATWIQASAGPRISYLIFGRFVPYVAVSGTWMGTRFRMDEVLADLAGSATLSGRSKSYVEVAFGTDWRISNRISVQACAGFLPYPGGVDSAVSVAVFAGL